MTRKIYLIALLSVFAPALLIPAAAAEPPPIVVCYPGGPVSVNDAEAAMQSMLRVVERLGKWKHYSLTSMFTAKADECRKLLAEKKPRFTIISLGLFLEQRDAHSLVPLVQPRINGASSERYQVVARRDRFHNLEQIKGKTLAGSVLEEPEFIQKIVFAGKLDLRSFFVLTPSPRVLRALRSLDKGETDAVILNGQQSAALASLPLKNQVGSVFTSEEIPLMGMAADSKRSTAEERMRFTRAMEGMCTEPEGKTLCDLFGVDAFVAARPAAFEPLIKLWNEEK